MSTATAAAPPIPMSFREVLRIDVMRRVWYAQVVSLFGDFLALFAAIAVVSFGMRGTPRQIVGVQIASILPMVFIGPIAGVFVDRWPLKPTLICSDLLRAVIAVLLIPATNVWQVYIVLAALSCVSAFFSPAQQVTIRMHVPAHGLISANALMQIAFMGSRVVGPGAAGAIVAALGPGVCYGVDVASFLISAALIASVAIQRATAAPRGEGLSTNRIHQIWLDMRQGLSFIVHHAAVVFVVMAMAAGLFTVGCFGPLVAIHVRDTLHGTERLFGIVSGTVGFGMLAGTRVMRKLSQRFADDLIVLSGLAGIGIGAGSRHDAVRAGCSGRDGNHRNCVFRDHGAGANAAATRDSARDDCAGVEHEHLGRFHGADSRALAVRVLGRRAGCAVGIHPVRRAGGRARRRGKTVPPYQSPKLKPGRGAGLTSQFSYN